MRFRFIKPDQQVAAYARMFWLLEAEGPKDNPYSYHAMADGCPELVFVYKGKGSIGNDTIASCTLLAQSSVPRTFTMKDDFGIMGVYLYPYMIPKLFNVPADSFNNGITDISLLNPIAVRILLQQLQDALSDEQRVQYISRFLLQQVESTHREDAIEGIIKQMLQANGQADTSRIVKDYYVSQRQFQRKFKQTAGFSASFFNKLVRFQAALREYKHIEELSLTDIALKCGYYDQSHFIRDFKTFSGVHPKTFFAGNTPGAEVLAGI